MIVWICTDMEGLAGISTWNQCYAAEDDHPDYLYGRRQLTEDANAAIAGCFDAGATEVRILDGHGRNQNRGFMLDLLDPRAARVWFRSLDPVRWEGLDESVAAVAMIGQHARVNTIRGFLDHTQAAKVICSYRLNGAEQGELGQMALYAGVYGVPLVFLSGDEAACAEARGLFPHVRAVPTKRGLGWEACELYDTTAVRASIRAEIARALGALSSARPWTPNPPITVRAEWSWAGAAEGLAQAPGVRRISARTVAWDLEDPRDVFTWPSSRWSPKPRE